MSNTITDTITELADNKSDIQDALVAKGVTSAGKHGFNKFAEDITSITNQYGSSDEGKVVSSGALVAQTDYGTVTDNGTYNTTTNDSVTVALPLTTKSVTSNGTYSASSDSVKGYTQVSVSVPNTYVAGDEGKVVSSGSLVAQTSTTATVNGTINTTTNNEVVVNVPNSYTAGDEGKVVSNGALVAQTAYPTTIMENGTYNTTENNSVTVNVPSLPTGTDICKLTPISSDITSSEMYAVNIENATIVFGFFTATEGADKIFSYPSSFNFARTTRCKYWLNAKNGNYLSGNYGYSVNTSSHQVSLYRIGDMDYPVVYCFT